MEHGNPKLGFGCMRLPVTDSSNPTSFDFDKIEALFDAFIANGFTYFDTAYTYHGYQAERAVRRALVERYPRNAFELATKFPLRDFKDAAHMEVIFNEQLENCGVEYFDWYLLHNIGENVYGKCEKYGAFDFAARKKAEGKIKNLGMSFHDMPELFEEILKKHGEILDFVQLQVNYVDWEQPNVQARRCVEIANKYGKPIIVMEPCKGGTLANVPEEVEKLFRACNPNATPAGWAMRYAASVPGVIRVLSGMNTMEQVKDNCSTFTDFKPLSEEERAAVDKAAEIILSNVAVPCTGCEYCTHDCPKGIPIPKYFALYNSIMANTGSFSSQQVYYTNTALKSAGAGECLDCGQCENACPQHIAIRENLRKIAEKFENDPTFPIKK